MKRRRKQKYLNHTFRARRYPEMISIIGPDPARPEVGAEDIVGPFCWWCGNPLSLHGPTERCPDQHLHPLFPPPALREIERVR